jgi:putative endonuclease
MNRQELARYGEKLALEYLQKKGYHFIERNFRKRYGELDLIVLTPDKKRLVIVEVKARNIHSQVGPKEAITSSKLSQVKSTTIYYKKLMGDSVPDPMRIDVIAILLNDDNSIMEFDHFKNVTM